MKKTIIVTGASGGIGSDICPMLIDSSYDLVLCARNLEKLNTLCSSLNSRRANAATCLQLDFDNSDSINTCVDEFLALNKSLNGIIIMPPQIEPTKEILPDGATWNSIFQKSFIGPTSFLRRLISDAKWHDKSDIVLISGISSAQVLSHYATSNVLRTMWVGLMKTLSHSIGPRGIRANTISLGGVLTAKYEKHLEAKASTNEVSIEQQMDSEVDNVPLRKYASTEDVGHAVLSLMGGLSDHMTGANLMVDGGFTRRY